MTDNLNKFSRDTAEFIEDNADLIADKVTMTAMRTTAGPAATSSVWSYTIPFELRSSRTGRVLPCNGNIAATVGDTSSAGTAAVDTATPTVFMGRGQSVISGDAAAWLAADTATLTLTYTNLRGGTSVATFVVTFV
jgi:hypothetical protein